MPFSLKKYSELVKIADGGMSQIFRAVDSSTHQTVVIKKMALDQAHRSFSSELIQNEIRNASMLSHHNIISLLDYGEHENDFYIVMEYVDGCDLNSLISDNDFNPEIGLLVVFKALQALHFSHSKGIIHCDIKPSNILIDKSGRVVLSDFGLSQAKAYEKTFNNVLNDFTTPLFMPPEQADVVAEIVGLKSDEWAETTTIVYKEMSAEQARALMERGKQWDIWAVGVLLYRIISGYYPFFENDFANLLNSIKYSEAPNVSDFVNNLPLSIAKVIEDCLRKDPYQRPQSLEPVIDALQDYFICRGITNADEMIASYMKEKFDVTHSDATHSIDPSVQKSSNTVIENKTQSSSTDLQNNEKWEYIDFETLSYSPPQNLVKNKKDNQQQTLFNEELQEELPEKPQEELSEGPQEELLNEQIPSEQLQTQTKELIDNAEVSTPKQTPQNEISFSFQSWFSRPIVLTALAALFVCLLVGGFVFVKVQKGKNPRIAEFAVNTMDTQDRNTSNAVSPESDQIYQWSESPSPVIEQSAKKQLPVNTTPKIRSSSNKTVQPKNLQKAKPVQPQVQPPAQSPIEQHSPVNASEDSDGLIKVTIDPPDAKVFIDGSILFQSELANGKKMSAGTHTVTAKAAEYKPYERSIIVEQGKTVILSVELKPDVKGNGQLHIYSYPWANLYIDDVLVGTTPTPSPILLIEGNHRIVLKREGFQTYNQDVTIKNGETTRLQVQLEKGN